MKKLPTKFWIRVYDTQHFLVIQDRLYALGFTWDEPKFKKIPAYEQEGCCLSVEGNGDMGYGSLAFYQDNDGREYGRQITTDDLFACAPNKIIKVKLSSGYTAELSSEGIKVGCQTFSLDIIDKLVDARKQLD